MLQLGVKLDLKEWVLLWDGVRVRSVSNKRRRR
jgi:hypothetical protein